MINSKSHVKACNKENTFKYTFSPRVTKLVTEQVINNGRVMNKSSFQEVNLAEERKSFKAEDFYLENLLAVGAVGNLREVSLDNSGLSAVDNVISQLSNIEVSE